MHLQSMCHTFPRRVCAEVHFVVLMFCVMLDMLDMLGISAMRSITPARLPHSAELEAMRLVAGRQPDGVEVGSMGHCSSIALGLILRHSYTCS